MPRSRAGWIRVRFGDVVRLVRDRVDPETSGVSRYVAGEHMDTDDLRIHRWGEVGDGYLGPAFHMRFKPGHVLYGSRRTYLRKVAVADFEGICANTTFVLESADPTLLLPELLPFVMQTEAFHDHSIKQSKGSVNPYVNFSDLAWYEFDLPPMTEQLIRYRTLSHLWEAVESHSSAIRSGADLRDALLVHLFSRGTRGESRSPTPIGDIPHSWTVARLDERYDVQLGKMVSPKTLPDATPCPYLRNENVQWNRLDLSDVKQMGFTHRERTRFELRYGDVLACEGRHVGKAAMWRDEIPGACYQKALHRLRAKSDADLPEYILHCFRYYSITKRFVVDTAETTIPHLALERLRPMLFPFSPVQEQSEIVDRIAVLDSAIASSEHRLASVRHVLRSMNEHAP